jgi:hypothetical protein
MGVFAKRDFLKDEIVLYYEGFLLIDKEWNQLRRQGIHLRTVTDIDLDKIIPEGMDKKDIKKINYNLVGDPCSPSGIVNDPLGPMKHRNDLGWEELEANAIGLANVVMEQKDTEVVEPIIGDHKSVAVKGSFSSKYIRLVAKKNIKKGKIKK